MRPAISLDFASLILRSVILEKVFLLQRHRYTYIIQDNDKSRLALRTRYIKKQPTTDMFIYCILHYNYYNYDSAIAPPTTNLLEEVRQVKRRRDEEEEQR